MKVWVCVQPSKRGTVGSRLTGAESTNLCLVGHITVVSGHITDGQSFLPPPALLLEVPRFPLTSALSHQQSGGFKNAIAKETPGLSGDEEFHRGRSNSLAQT